VKALLDFSKVSYESVDVNPLTKSEIKFSGSKSVPVAKFGDVVICGSGDIIDHFRKYSTNDELWTEDSEKWMLWSEKKLAVLLYPNITRTFAESWKAFSYVEDVKTWTKMQRVSNRVMGPIAMFMVNGKIKAKYGIKDERAELLALLLEWTEAVGRGSGPFLHGEAISLPDLMVFGVLKGIDVLPTFDFIMNQNAVLKKWYGDVSNKI
jgi:microsomal prostaglandin-E synthase 2